MDGQDRMSVAFFGVRGSRPAPDARYLEYGGNTSCVGVSMGEARVLLDAGSGITNVPEAYWQRGETHVFLSHLHHDHISGLMFYGALHAAGCKVRVHIPSAVAPGSLESYWRSPYFPIALGATKAHVALETVSDGERKSVGSGEGGAGLWVEAMLLGRRVHPSCGVAVYRVLGGGRALVYATDVELADEASKRAVAAFSQGADLLILDAHFADEEYRSFAGWGHNSVGMALEVAAMAGCRRLVLFHHHPCRDDVRMAALEQDAAHRLPGVRAAREGECVVI